MPNTNEAGLVREIPKREASELDFLRLLAAAGIAGTTLFYDFFIAGCTPQNGQLAPESEAPADGENAQEVGENDDLEAGSIPVITPSPTSEATTNANSSEIVELTVIKPSLGDFPEHDSWQSLVDEIGAGFSSDSEVIERLGLQEGDTIVSQVGVLVFEDGNKNHQYLAFISTQDSEGKRVEYVTRYFDDLTSNFSELELESSSQGLQWVTEIDSERGGVITVDLETGNITGPYETNLGNIFDDFSESKAVNGGIGVLASFSKIEVENAQTLEDAKATLAQDGVKLALGKNGWLIIDQRGDTTILLFEEVDGVLKKAAEGAELSPEAAELLDAVDKQIDEAEAPTDGAVAADVPTAEAETQLVSPVFEDAVFSESKDVRLGISQDGEPDIVQRGTMTFSMDSFSEDGKVPIDRKVYRANITSNFPEDVLKIIGIDAQAFAEYLRQVPGFDGNEFELNVEMGEDGVYEFDIFFLDMEAVDDEGENPTDEFTRKMQGGTGASTETLGDLYDAYGRSSERLPYVVVLNLSTHKKRTDLAGSPHERLQELAPELVTYHLATALFVGELGVGDDKGLMVNGKLITSMTEFKRMFSHTDVFEAVMAEITYPFYTDVIMDVELADW